MSYSKILALDLGKFKSVGCAMDCATRRHAFVTLQTDRAALVEWVTSHQSARPADTLVVFETCDAAGWIHDALVPLGVSITVVNCNDERWRWRKVKRKTDRDDALKLARLALLDQLPTVHLPDPPSRQKRRLMLHRRAIVTRRTQCRNAIRSIFSQQDGINRDRHVFRQSSAANVGRPEKRACPVLSVRQSSAANVGRPEKRACPVLSVHSCLVMRHGAAGRPREYL